MLSDEEILEAAGDTPGAQALCERLVEMANERGGVDNITVVVADLARKTRPSGSVAPAGTVVES
jgi:protein phosphatase